MTMTRVIKGSNGRYVSYATWKAQENQRAALAARAANARIPPSQDPGYDLTFRIPGSSEKFDFTYRAPSSEKSSYDFTQ
jgi:hypothetical protein